MPDHPSRADVLDSYRQLPRRADESAVCLPTDVIACGDEDLLEAALALGRALGRPVVSVDVTAGWPEETVGPADSVLLFARRSGCSAESVRDWVASAFEHDIPLGFVLAEEAEEAEFQVSKIMLGHTRILSGDDAVIGAADGMCGEPDDLQVTRPERLNRILAARWRLLAIGGHSELGHVGLSSHVICGATEPERVGGRLLADGCDPGTGRCRCTTRFTEAVVPALSLHAAIVALMGCSTFDLTAVEHPTTNSLCASSLSGQPIAVIGTLGQLSADFDAVGQLANSVAEGISLGAAVQRLNRSHRIPTGYGIVLAGDPALRFPSRTLAAAAGTQTAFLEDCRDRAQPVLDRCHEMIRRSRMADRLGRALLRVCDQSLEPGLEDALEVLGRRVEQVQDAAWEGVRLMQESVDYRHWQEPDRVLARLDRSAGRWGEAFAAAASLVGGNDMYSALHTYHQLDSIKTGGSCARCGSRIQVFGYSDPELSGRQRIAAECWLCGPVQESADTGTELTITSSGIYAPGTLVRPGLSVGDLPGQENRTGYLAVVLNERQNDKVFASERAECNPADIPELAVTIPAGARSDLHVLWAMWVSDLSVSFAATRLAVIRAIE